MSDKVSFRTYFWTALLYWKRFNWRQLQGFQCDDSEILLFQVVILVSLPDWSVSSEKFNALLLIIWKASTHITAQLDTFLKISVLDNLNILPCYNYKWRYLVFLCAASASLICYSHIIELHHNQTYSRVLLLDFFSSDTFLKIANRWVTEFSIFVNNSLVCLYLTVANMDCLFMDIL